MSAVTVGRLMESYGRWEARVADSEKQRRDAQVFVDLWSKAPFLVRLGAVVVMGRKG